MNNTTEETTSPDGKRKQGKAGSSVDRTTDMAKRKRQDVRDDIEKIRGLLS